MEAGWVTVTVETVSTMAPLLTSIRLMVRVERLRVSPVRRVRLAWAARISFVTDTMAACSSVSSASSVV